MNYFTLPAGNIDLKKRDFSFSLTHPLDISVSSGRMLLQISGENGSGKTSFCELVLIPALQKNRIIFDFKAQDAHLQNISSCCLETVYNLTRRNLLKEILFNSDIQKITTKKMPLPQVVILDETDKNLSADEFNSIISNPQYKLVIIISHLIDLNTQNSIIDSFEHFCQLQISGSGNQRKVLQIK